MSLTQNVKGISRLVMLFLLIIAFLLGATLSYVWTMGFYAPSEFKLPGEPNLTIEKIQFLAIDSSYFNVTALNPSYSPSDAIIQGVKVATSDDKVNSSLITDPTMPFTLASGKTQIFRVFWSWGAYSGQAVDVYLIITGGSGPAVQSETAFVNLTVTNIDFEPAVAVTRFNVTVQSEGSPVDFDVNGISVMGVDVSNLSAPSLPYHLRANSSAKFTLNYNWTSLQNDFVTVQVTTEQGYIASNSATAPSERLAVSNVVFFNTTSTSFYFNATVQNLAFSAARVDVNSVTVHVGNQTIPITNVSPSLPYALDPGSQTVLMCSWDWSSLRGKNVTVTIGTVQAFTVSSIEYTIPTAP